MIELPPLPDPDSPFVWPHLIEDYKIDLRGWARSYGEACARAALEAAARECDSQLPKDQTSARGFAMFGSITRCAEAIRALKVTP